MNESIENPYDYMVNLVMNILPLEKWEFIETYHSHDNKNIIYDSQNCRLNIVWLGWDYMGGNSISILYGRLHAPNEEGTMIWNGEEYRCWHRIETMINFLDGNPPHQIAKFEYSHRITDLYYQANMREKYSRKQPEWILNMHKDIWEQYAPRIFQLLDLHNPTIWEQYRNYLVKIYDIKGRSENITPPFDKVC